MSYSKVYQGHCYYIGINGIGVSGSPFMVYEANDGLISMQMLRDLDFSFRTKVGESVDVCIYKIPLQNKKIHHTTQYLIQNVKRIEPYIKMRIEFVSASRFDVIRTTRTCLLVFHFSKEENDTILMATPTLRILKLNM